MRENFLPKLRLNAANKIRLNTVNEIISEYRAQGYILTLRQLYYQLVTKNVIPNSDKEYAKLSKLLTEGRMAGVVDWSAIEDRVRRPQIPYSVDDIPNAMQDTIDQYRLDRMLGQETYIEVWVEKDALSAVFSRVTNKYHIRPMVNRGYSSSSAMYAAYQRFADAYERGAKKCLILYFGDHDPSGLDMIRDVRDRISEMLVNGNNSYSIIELVRESDYGLPMWDDDKNEYTIEPFDLITADVFVTRQIALNMDQIRQYTPPENPAKITDPRAKWYIEKWGTKSWELDALPPSVLATLCERAILEYIDEEEYAAQIEQEETDKLKLVDFKNTMEDE